ncbi:hypothetical protein [Lysinibacillus sp. RS5]|uniref:hypothetical protein n=1 Tax=unclassified Lysinibacillus TaxID=2636778 RepID=UPI0035BE9809
MDMQQTMNNVFNQMVEEGKIEEIIRKQVESTVESVVKDTLGSWSSFSKHLEENLKEQVKLNIDKFKLPDYNLIIKNTIEEHAEAIMHEQGVKKMKEALDEMLVGDSTEIKFSELLLEMVKDEMELEDLGYDECKEISVHVDDSYSSLAFIYFDPETDKRQYECKYRLTLNAQGTINTVEIGGHEFKNSVIMGGLRGIGRTLFKAYARGTKIIIDDYETEFGNPEYD